MESQVIIEAETNENPFCRHEVYKQFEDGEYVIFELMCRDSQILLNNIRVAEEDLGKGIGTKGMEWLKSVSERSKDLIVGHVEPNGHKKMTRAQLTKWYKKLGFVEERGKIVYYPKSLY